MPYDYSQLPHEGIQSLSPYIPGKSAEELAEEKGLTNIIKLASNENQRGCSALVTQKLSKLSTHDIASYAIPAVHPIRKKLARFLGVETEMVVLGNGSDALIPLLNICFALHSDRHVITHQYAFVSYQIHSDILGVPVINTPVLDNWQVDIDAIISTCNEKTALIFLANPNNPTGSLVPSNEIERLLNSIPESTILVLDEAYYEYAVSDEYFNGLKYLNKYPNLIVTRTFSKAYGLAGLRIGYLVTSPVLSNIIMRALPPFTVNEVALIAAEAALEDQAFVKESALSNQAGLKQMQLGLQELGFDYIPSVANFISFDCKRDSTELYLNLQSQGIIVRPLHQYKMNNYLRVTIGTHEQNSRFLNTLKELSCK